MHLTSVINIENNDGKIWHRDNVIIDLMQAIYSNNDIVIALNGEGPCAENLSLYKLLDEVCDKNNYDHRRIIVQTCNLLEYSDKYQIVISPPIKHILYLQQMIQDGLISTKKIKKIFGHFIGHSSRFRLVIASWLYKYYKNKTLQTFHTSPTDPLHREFIGLEDLWLNSYDYMHVNNAVEFLRHTPFRYDQVGSGPILDIKMYGILGAYEDIFVDIVCNTYITGNTFYLDEKLWRPIMTQTPFIVHGPRNFIKNLQALGFKTFDSWWDEGYSEDPPDCQVFAILKIIDQLSNYSAAELAVLYQEMQPVLEHNLQVFKKLNRNSFLNKNFK